MWAITVDKSGDSSIIEVEKPTPKPHEILIKTYAAGINRADLFQAQGLYPPPIGTSNILGLEVAGIIEDIGSEVTEFQIGDKVCALLEGGGYAQFAVAAQTQSFAIPHNLDFAQAASLPEAIFTAYSNLFDHAHMKSKETLLMHGGASGLGTFVIQMANAFGINSIATAGSDEKCIFLRKLGAIDAINYKTDDFAPKVMAITKDKGVDCIFDIVGASYFKRNLKILANKGRMICLSCLEGAYIEANLAPLIFKNLSITGTTLRGKTLKQKHKIRNSINTKILPLLKDGSIKPVIDSIFKFQEADLAHKLMHDSKHIGKIILKCD